MIGATAATTVYIYIYIAWLPFQEEAAKVIQDAVLPSGTVAAEGLRAWFRSLELRLCRTRGVGSFCIQYS